METGEPKKQPAKRMAKFRVLRISPTAVNPPCPCSHDEPIVVWEGESTAEYRGGLGSFDEGCHHPSLEMQEFSHVGWIPVGIKVVAEPCICGSCYNLEVFRGATHEEATRLATREPMEIDGCGCTQPGCHY